MFILSKSDLAKHSTKYSFLSYFKILLENKKKF